MAHRSDYYVPHFDFGENQVNNTDYIADFTFIYFYEFLHADFGRTI